MSPLFRDGDVVLANLGAYRAHSPQIGDVVIARHPYQTNEIIIKRIAAIDDEGRYELRGENPLESTDSRSFGAVSPALILGRVTCRL